MFYIVKEALCVVKVFLSSKHRKAQIILCARSNQLSDAEFRRCGAALSVTIVDIIPYIEVRKFQTTKIQT